ncbi:MAG: sugar-transfer associated ATP-grasp domain-containing protein [Bacteroidota bacterium]
MKRTIFQQWTKQELSQSILGMNERNSEWVYKANPRKHFKWANDKILTKSRLEQLEIACASTYGIVERMIDVETVWEQVSEYPALAIKPAKGLGGGGIMVLKKDANGNWKKGSKEVEPSDVFMHIANILQGIYSMGDEDRALIEYCIHPHPFFLEIYPDGVADFRVILYRDKPIMAMLRVPTDQSGGKANLHQGGLGIGVDMEWGCLTQGFNGSEYFDSHPDSGFNILGCEIPYWKEILELSIQCSQGFPELNYLGVDIVIDEELGPLVMEINVRPGLAIQLVNHTGLKPALRKNS